MSGYSIFRKKRKRRGWLAVAPLLAAGYLLAAPPPGGEEVRLRPGWALSLADRESFTAEASPGAAHWFRAGRSFGYFEPDGHLLYVGQVLHRVALSASGFINYGKVPERFVFRDVKGNLQYSFQSYGYPVLDPSGEVLMLVSSDRTGLRRVTRDGEVVWQASFASPITSLALRGGEALAGLLGGSLYYLGEKGQVLLEFSPGGSRLPVILGVAVQPAGEQIAVISGIDPQRLTVIGREGRQFEPRFGFTLESDFRRETMMRYTEDGRYLLLESAGGVGLVDLRRRRLHEVAVPGRVVALEPLDRAGLVAVASRAQGGGELVLVRPPDMVVLRSRLPAAGATLRAEEGALFVGLPGYLLRVDLAELER